LIDQISIENLGKRYLRQWVFRKLQASFSINTATAIVGANGSGKSTLIQTIGGFFPPSEGTVTYTSNKKAIEKEDIYKDLAFSAPYMSLIEELTLLETIELHQNLKGFRGETTDFIDWVYLNGNETKQIKYFSSGMRQRLKLALAFRSAGSVLLLDEPTANLDKTGIVWYNTNVHHYKKDRILIIASNNTDEYDFCDQQLSVQA
jgi:ABC-type multidrug transport system ATPase subunit